MKGTIKLQRGEEILILDLETELNALTCHENEDIMNMSFQLLKKIYEKDPTWIGIGILLLYLHLIFKDSPDTTDEHFDIRVILKDLSDPLAPIRSILPFARTLTL